MKGPGVERGMVFQQGALFEWLTVERNVAFGPAMAGRSRRETRERVAHLLETVGLAGFGDKPVYQLSGGMQQRVALARCLAGEPEVILMDEPLGALDALTRERMQGLILRLWKETGRTVVLITHSVEEGAVPGRAARGHGAAPGAHPPHLRAALRRARAPREPPRHQGLARVHRPCARRCCR